MNNGLLLCSLFTADNNKTRATEQRVKKFPCHSWVPIFDLRRQYFIYAKRNEKSSKGRCSTMISLSLSESETSPPPHFYLLLSLSLSLPLSGCCFSGRSHHGLSFYPLLVIHCIASRHPSKLDIRIACIFSNSVKRNDFININVIISVYTTDTIKWHQRTKEIFCHSARASTVEYVMWL